MSKQKITMTIDEKVFIAFKELCKRRAMKVSSKVELMMREFVEQSDDVPVVARTRKTSSRKSSVRHDRDEAQVDTQPPTPERADNRDDGDAR